MPDIVFQVDIAAARAAVARAISSESGIRGWWTARADVPSDVGAIMKLGFAAAPVPFELRIDELSNDRVRWANVGAVPPHWANTTIDWRLSDLPDGATRVDFAHANWPSYEGGFGMSAYTWGHLLTSLRAYAETGTGNPLPS